MQLKPSSRGAAAGRALPRRSAFTLLELLVVIGLIATLTFVAVPAFKGFGQANTLAAAQRQIQDDLALARQLAIKHRTPVYLVFFSPDPDAPSKIAQDSAKRVGAIHNYLSSLASSDYREHALRLLTNVFASQHASYAFYTEGKLGDQPFLTPTGTDGNADIRRGRYLTVGGSIWRTLPDGIVFAPGLRLRLNQFVSTNLTTKLVPFPLAPEPGDPQAKIDDPNSLELNLPAIAYDSFGRAMKLDGNGKIDVNGVPQDQFVSIGIGSVFVPHSATATNNYDFSRLGDVVETPKENYTNTIFRVTGLTGRARKFVWGTQP
ncbi:MAG TPA: hypothetical protein VMB21_19145 [Candidatus Limnocylindria bacterium]|jgi:type II secretory pathway pseudopilin PulG|nr:hypothetical protein [Candidatus Limnocylindria bacterium]